jgi:serine/threonine protein kinase
MSSFISNENTPLSNTKTLLTKSSQSHFDLQTLQSLSLNSSHQQIIRDYTLLKQLGKGAYASVYLCQHNKSKKLYAMKIIDKFFLSQHNKTNDVLIEKAMLSSINHSNIIKLIQTFQSKSKLFFILELATNSTLDVLIEKYPFVLSHKCIKTFCFQIAKALKYLHMKKLIVHRDIKPANICLDENYNVKLIDFASGTEIGKVFNAKNKCFEKEKEDVNYIKEPIGSYEYVPAIGAVGGAYRTGKGGISTVYTGYTPTAATDRKTGGGGGGGMIANSKTTTSGSGGTGTSYSGGAGGGGAYY